MLGLFVALSLLSIVVVGQLPLEGVLSNLTITDANASLLISWSTEKAGTAFQFISIDYQQALPDHSTRNLFVPTTHKRLKVNGTRYTYTIDKTTFNPTHLGPLLVSVSASTATAMHQSNEVLYKPSATDQSMSDFEMSILWPDGINCETFVTTVSADSIVGEFEVQIRTQSPLFKSRGKIENFGYYCNIKSAVCSGKILASDNATVYRDILLSWMSSVGSYIILNGQRYTVTEKICTSLEDSKCVKSTTSRAHSNEGTITTADITLIISFIALATVILLLFGLIMYLIISKCFIVKSARRSDKSIEMETRNGRRGHESSDKEDNYMDMN